ncbi:CRISPR-associated protein Cas4 [Halobellus sp. Atlit-31R]|nr:CRISPR-associated protein Cas4 [Halobellus sp. Atlit-31R]
MTPDSTLTGQLVPVAALSQYLYCPRRYWYYRFFDPDDRSADLIEGNRKHERQARRPDWVRERYLRSEQLGLHGRVDVMENASEGESRVVPVERKRASSGQVYWNDEIQVTAYGLLIEATLDGVDELDYGIVYLYETDERHRIEFSSDRRQAVHDVREEIHQLEPDTPPSPVTNRNKCSGCSVRHYCQPETETHLNNSNGWLTSVVDGGDRE